MRDVVWALGQFTLAAVAGFSLVALGLRIGAWL